MNWLFGYEGRINRAKYFFAILIYLIPYGICLLIARESEALGFAIFIPLVFLTAMPVAKRLHDLNHSGWWQLLGLVPLVNFGLGIYMLAWRGTLGPNRFGPDPLAENATAQDSPFQQVAKSVGGLDIPAAVSKIEQIDKSVRTPELQNQPVSVQANTANSAIAGGLTTESAKSLEDNAYEVVALELENNTQSKGLWTRLFAECNGDEKAMKVLYIKLRVEQLISAELARVKEEDEAVRMAASREQEEKERLSQLSERALMQHYITNGQFEMIKIPDDASQFLRAILEHKLQLVQEFLERDVGYLGACGDYGNTPLHIAIVEGNPRIALLLIEYGAAVNVKNAFGVDLLALARSTRGMSNVADAIESARIGMVAAIE